VVQQVLAQWKRTKRRLADLRASIDQAVAQGRDQLASAVERDRSDRVIHGRLPHQDAEKADREVWATDGHGCTLIENNRPYPCASVCIRGQQRFFRGPH
jgi:hypothetical protein